MSINKAIIVGRLGSDPELKYTPSGASVCNFSVATSETWNDKSGQKQERTEWHRIVVWGKIAETCNQYLSKGRQVYIEGRIQTRSWEDKEGQKRYTTEINANSVQFLGDRAGAGAGANREQGQRQEAAPQPNSGGGAMNQNYELSTDSNFTADDIPF